MAQADEITPALAWDWSRALLGVTYAAPAAALVLIDPPHGLALGVGVLPAAAAGLPGPRRARLVIIVLGALMGISIVIGSALAQVPPLAVPAIFALCVAAAMSAPSGKPGQLALGLCVPLIGIGLSYQDLRQAVGIALLMVLGSVYAFLVSLAWPARLAADPHTPPTPTGRQMLGYGVRLGLAGSLAAAIGFGLDLDHVGWACGAALMVMRPVPEMLRMRGVDRVGSVLIGAAAGGALMLLDPPNIVLAVALLGALAALAATQASHRWITGLFTTFIVFLLLLLDSPEETTARFLERVNETVLGVSLAVIFGLLVPALLRRRSRPASDVES